MGKPKPTIQKNINSQYSLSQILREKASNLVAIIANQSDAQVALYPIEERNALIEKMLNSKSELVNSHQLGGGTLMDSITGAEETILRLLKTMPQNQYPIFHTQMNNETYGKLFQVIDGDNYREFVKTTNKISFYTHQKQLLENIKTGIIPTLNFGRFNIKQDEYTKQDTVTNYNTGAFLKNEKPFDRRITTSSYREDTLTTSLSQEFGEQTDVITSKTKTYKEQNYNHLKPTDLIRVKIDDSTSYKFQIQELGIRMKDGSYLMSAAAFDAIYNGKWNQAWSQSASIAGVVIGAVTLPLSATALGTAWAIGGIAAGIGSYFTLDNEGFQAKIRTGKATAGEMAWNTNIQRLNLLFLVTSLGRGGLALKGINVKNLDTLIDARLGAGWRTATSFTSNQLNKIDALYKELKTSSTEVQKIITQVDYTKMIPSDLKILQPALQGITNTLSKYSNTLKEWAAQKGVDFSAQINAIQNIFNKQASGNIKAISENISKAKNSISQAVKTNLPDYQKTKRMLKTTETPLKMDFSVSEARSFYKDFFKRKITNNKIIEQGFSFEPKPQDYKNEIDFLTDTYYWKKYREVDYSPVYSRISEGSKAAITDDLTSFVFKSLFVKYMKAFLVSEGMSEKATHIFTSEFYMKRAGDALDGNYTNFAGMDKEEMMLLKSIWEKIGKDVSLDIYYASNPNISTAWLSKKINDIELIKDDGITISSTQLFCKWLNIKPDEAAAIIKGEDNFLHLTDTFTAPENLTRTKNTVSVQDIDRTIEETVKSGRRLDNLILQFHGDSLGKGIYIGGKKLELVDSLGRINETTYATVKHMLRNLPKESNLIMASCMVGNKLTQSFWARLAKENKINIYVGDTVMHGLQKNRTPFHEGLDNGIELKNNAFWKFDVFGNKSGEKLDLNRVSKQTGINIHSITTLVAPASAAYVIHKNQKNNNQKRVGSL